MEAKKSKKADLDNKRGLFMEIGLIVALAIVIIMFSVSQREKIIEAMAPVASVDEVEMIDVTTEKEPETVPVQHQTVSVITDVLNVVRNETKIETSIGWVDFEDEDIDIAPIQVETEEIEEETIFIVADEKPTFQGGDLNTFRNWVQSRLTYPALAQENNIQGTVTVKFVVEKDGRLTNIQVLKSPDKTLSDEAVQVLAKSPKWAPARQRDMAVRFSYTMPIVFKLQN
jgi:protein TonB